MATFKFANGVSGVGNWCYVADKNVNEVQIVGEKGRIVFDGLSLKSFKVIKGDDVETYEFEEPEHVSMPYQQSIVNELIGKEKSNANFDHAVNLVKVTEKLLKTFYN